MSGTPEKILEHMLETIKLETNGTDFIGMADPWFGTCVPFKLNKT